MKWLIQKLLLVELDPDHHFDKHGLSQGGAGSGFYANTFLVPLDSSFGIGDNRYYRYMDDVYLVIPETHELHEVKARLDKELACLGLKRSCKKTTHYDSESYLGLKDYDETLDNLSDRFIYLTNCLWYMNRQYRRELQSSENWWKFIDIYRKKLHSLDVYVEADRLSRKLHQYFSNRKRREDKRSGRVNKLTYPELQDEAWHDKFESMNSKWIKCRNEIRVELQDLLRCAYHNMLDERDDVEKRILETKITFCANRLTRWGFATSKNLLRIF